MCVPLCCVLLFKPNIYLSPTSRPQRKRKIEPLGSGPSSPGSSYPSRNHGCPTVQSARARRRARGRRGGVFASAAAPELAPPHSWCPLLCRCRNSHAYLKKKSPSEVAKKKCSAAELRWPRLPRRRQGLPRSALQSEIELPDSDVEIQMPAEPKVTLKVKTEAAAAAAAAAAPVDAELAKAMEEIAAARAEKAAAVAAKEKLEAKLAQVEEAARCQSRRRG